MKMPHMWGRPYVHVGDHMIPVPYKVRGAICICGGIQYPFHIRYGWTVRVISDMKTPHMYGEPYVYVGDHKSCISSACVQLDISSHIETDRYTSAYQRVWGNHKMHGGP